MILFEKIRYKNILSTGNAFTEIDLNDSKSTLIIGENGAGKSTFLDALTFVLYGKPFRKINKPQLMNSINQKDLLVEVEIDINSIKYLIKRGMRPHIFEIYRNGELIPQDAASKDYQLYLEENVLKLNYKSFGQVVVLGSSTFVPFMQLSAQNRREIIEDLLDLQIFSNMNSILKEKSAMNKQAIQDNRYKIDINRNAIQHVTDYSSKLIKLKKEEISKVKDKIKTTKDSIDENKSEIKLHEKEIVELAKNIVDSKKIDEKTSFYREIKDNFNRKIHTIEGNIDFYASNNVCPTCAQTIDENFKENHIKCKKEKIDELNGAIEAVKEKIALYDSRLIEIKNVKTNISVLEKKIDTLDVEVRIKEGHIASYKQELDKAKQEETEIDSSKLTKLKEVSKELEEDRQKFSEERDIISTVAVILKDGGIKTKIIKQYIPIINRFINKYLTAMDFFIDFQLDESFNEKILSRFRDEFSYSSFSEGEKLRIDLSLMFAWRAISKARNSISTNLLIMDEVLDGSLDNAGTDEFLKIINELTADTNVFIISHKGDSLADKFIKTLKFKKIKNFSSMEIIQ